MREVTSPERRFPVPVLSELTGAQKAFVDRVTQFSLSGAKALEGPFGLMARAPHLGEVLLELGNRLRFSTGIDDRYLELAILVHARCRKDQYEWKIHHARALEKGLSAQVVEAIRIGAEPDFADEIEAAIYHFTRQLRERNAVEDGVYTAVRSHFGDEGVATLTIFLGNYALVSDIVAVARLDPPQNDAPALPD